jgi:hypothetical protein
VRKYVLQLTRHTLQHVAILSERMYKKSVIINVLQLPRDTLKHVVCSCSRKHIRCYEWVDYKITTLRFGLVPLTEVSYISVDFFTFIMGAMGAKFIFNPDTRKTL